MIGRRFHAIAEARPGARLAALLHRNWQGYRAFWAKDGTAARPGLAACRAALAQHMPELLRPWEALVAAADGDEEQARFLSLWCPPDFQQGCSQAIWTRRPFAIVRNYDYQPGAFDAVLLRAELTGTATLAMVDCVWGVLDGLNAHGLAVSLSFGGRRARGPGFGVALIQRYLLETCRDVADALAALRRVPVHLCYNVALLDRTGERALVEIAPDRAPELRRQAFAGNRQGDHSRPEGGHLQDTVRREALLAACLANPMETLPGLIDRFLAPPLFRPFGADGWGTLYTACWLPETGEVRLCWPGQDWRQGLASFHEGERIAVYGA
jgi:predicted choloylglycine hydrolase